MTNKTDQSTITGNKISTGNNTISSTGRGLTLKSLSSHTHRGGLFFFLIMLGIVSCAYGKEYSDQQILKAVYFAEGGALAKYPYGIRSIPCSGDQCRVYCLNTIRNNRKRFAKQTKYTDFLEFLQSRYCPTSGKLSKAEQRLNGNWLKNVRYFLNRG